MTAGEGRHYQHAEAFCLMWYASEDGERERIWNSRDGVAPFVITLRSGKQAHHVDWHLDQRRPDYVPQPGERMFVDLGEELHRERWLIRAREHFADPGELGEEARAQWASAMDLGEELHRAQWRAGLPALVEVEPDRQVMKAGAKIEAGAAVVVVEAGAAIVMPYTCKHGVTAPKQCAQCMVMITGV